MREKLTEKYVAGLALPSGKAQLVVWDTDLTGFGVVIGKQTRTFVAEARVDRLKTRTKIGIAGRVREDGHQWTVTLARQRAKELLGEMASGVSPNEERRAHRDGITLRQGLELHVADMRKRRCAERSIETMEAEIPKHFPKALDRPLVDLQPLALHDVHGALSAEGKHYLANRLIAEVSAIWNTVDRLHELTGRNPATRVRRNKLTPKRERIDDADLSSWRTKVEALSPLRRDLQLVLIHTGLRSADARSIRWDDVDLNASTLHRPSPKGGIDKAFTLPLPKLVVELLRKRKRENAKEFEPYGGDHGLVFPSLSRAAPFVVQPLAQPKEYRQSGGRGGPKEKILPSPHVLRRTYISIGREIGIPEIDMHALANHSFSTGRVQDQYVRQAIAHLAECQERIAAALAARFENSPRKSRRTSR